MVRKLKTLQRLNRLYKALIVAAKKYTGSITLFDQADSVSVLCYPGIPVRKFKNINLQE